jgi:hypothetical protein
VKKRDDDGRHREAAYSYIAATSIVTTRTDFPVGKVLRLADKTIAMVAAE